jgi:hypothetical protein
MINKPTKPEPQEARDPIPSQENHPPQTNLTFNN